MTPSDQPADQQLTRRQLREIRMTGATPIVTPEAAADALAQSNAASTPADAPAASSSPATAEPVAAAPAPVSEAPAPVEPVAAPSLHLPREAETIVEPAAPVADAAVDLGTRARTRRQARDQERIRTNTIPVVAESPAPAVVPEPVAAAPAPAVVPEPVAAAPAPTVVPEPAPAADTAAAVVEESPWAPRAASTSAEPAAEPAPIVAPIVEPLAEEAAPVATRAVEPTPEHDNKYGVRSDFGANLLAQQESFDDLIRSSTSSGSAGSASTLILPEDASLTPLTAPVTSTGQVILTGTFALPEGLGSQGHAPGVADGRDVDAVLIDGELAPQSSPTPIAATAAVSQAKTPVEMIRPPAPEKSSKLVVALAITAGILSLAAIGFTIYVVTTGKFS